MKAVADKYILDDGTPVIDIMPDVEFAALRARYMAAKTRRHYAKEFRTQHSQRSFCERVRREFMNELAHSQREFVKKICSAKPAPTFEEYLKDYQENCRASDEWLPPLRNFPDVEFDCYYRVWARVRGKEWGKPRNDFEASLEAMFQTNNKEAADAQTLFKEIVADMTKPPLETNLAAHWSTPTLTEMRV